MNDSINKLKKKFPTNKFKLGYFEVYSQYFNNLKNKKLKILEIGIDKGPSLKLWSYYFKNSKIAAIDINPIKLNLKNVKIFCGDQSDSKFLNIIIKQFNYFDIIIDDGSHKSADVIKSFSILFNSLSDGGLYIIEDLHYSYYPRYGGSRINLKKSNTSMNFLKNLTDSINYENFDRPFFKKNNFDGRIKFIHFFQNCCVIKKGNSFNYFYKKKNNTLFYYLKKLISRFYK